MMESNLWRSRAVIIHRDDSSGFGLTVSGDNPVSVQTIKQGGAAEVAGIREGDVIIKVNGTMVDHMNHTEVVNLIKSAGPYVTLTVRPPEGPGSGIGIGSPIIVSSGGIMSSSAIPSSGNGGGSKLHHHHLHHAALPHERTVTAPLPVDRGIQLQMQDNKFRTLQVYRDQAVAEVEAALKKYDSSQNTRDKKELEKAEKSLRSIEAQMKKFRQSSPNLQLHSPAPFNPYPSSHQPVPFLPYPQQQNYSTGQQRVPLQRNRNPLSSQASVPCPTYSQGSTNWDLSPDIPPPLPPRSFSQSFNQPERDHHFFQHFTPPSYSQHDPLPRSGGPAAQAQVSTTTPTNSNNQNHTKSNSVSQRAGSAGASTPTNHITNSHNSQIQQHHRAKSSPDPVSMQKALMNTNNPDASRRSDSVNDLSSSNKKGNLVRATATSDSIDSACLKTPPPGSPPPPYGRHMRMMDDENNSGVVDDNLLSMMNQLTYPGSLDAEFGPNNDIISMEEDDVLLSQGSPNVSSIPGKHGPWSSLSKLLEHNAHLAVFMNYVIDNRCDPSSLLFYLITGLYVEEGTLKEMKRWGYEIHSTFTAPGSPLHVPHVDENISTEIDDALLRESDKEEMMRRVFRKARNKAKEEINKQLEEFCDKRTAGLGSMFGPPDSQLEECLTDKVKEARVIETYLVPRLEQYLEEYKKNSDDRTLAVVNSISTLLQKLFLIQKTGGNNSIMERCASFVSKEKSVRAKFMSKHKKVTYNGHHFSPQFIYSYTECNICCKILWGVGPQGYQCSDCNVNVHHTCINTVQDNCVGSDADGQNKKKDRLRQFKDKIRPASKQDVQKNRRSGAYPFKKGFEESLFPSLSLSGSPGTGDVDPSEKSLNSSGSSSSNLRNEKRPDTLSEEHLTADGMEFDDEFDNRHAHHEPNRRTSNAVGRSESCKERPQRKHQRERRKHSDPNLTTKSSDVDLETQHRLSDTNNSSSSNSSLSGRSLDSPSTSLELVAPGSGLHPSPLGHIGRGSSETPETGSSSHHSDSFRPSQLWEGDSDIEVEPTAPDWTKGVPDDVLQQLEPREKKRQEVLNELFHTERSHVRNLKVVDQLFHRPMKSGQLLPSDLLAMLFGNWEEILELHEAFNSILKKKKKESPVIGDIGPVLLEIFDGERAERFKSAAAACCSKQQIALKTLKEKREKNPKLNAFLVEAEAEPVCRRLQIQDMIPMAMQRLTKYPLMFEKLRNYCSDPESLEYKSIQRALDMSKEILNTVNHAKKEAEDNFRLDEIQRKIDKSALDKAYSLEKGIDKPDISFINELKNMDITKHKLVHEGSLHWRLKTNKQRAEVRQVDVQLVLLHDMIVIFVKQDEKYLLKIHMSSNYPGTAGRVILRPVIKLNNLIIRANAADKKAFMLINMTSSNMYDLVCKTTEERKVWLHHITKAAEDYKSKQESRRLDFLPSSTTATPSNIPSTIASAATPPPATSSDSDDKNKQSNLDGGDSGEGSSEVSGESSDNPHISNPDGASGSIDLTSNGKLGTSPAGNGKRSVSASPNPVRKVGEFLRITETLPLIDPSEVTVIPRNIHFAQPVVSQYEELKRVNDSISEAFGEKMKLVSQLLHIPNKDGLTKSTSSTSSKLEKDENLNQQDSSTTTSTAVPIQAKDLKELLIACFQEVDKLGRTIADQKVTTDNFPIVKKQTSIQNSLNTLLTQLLREVDRKEEELDVRRQELHRVREQNHGYQERLQNKSLERRTSTSGNGSTSKAIVSQQPSESSSDPPDEQVVMKITTHSKLQSSGPVAISNSNNISIDLENSNTTTACDRDASIDRVDDIGSTNPSAIASPPDPVTPMPMPQDPELSNRNHQHHEYENILDIQLQKQEIQRNNNESIPKNVKNGLASLPDPEHQNEAT